MLGAFSKLRRSTRSTRRPPVASKSRRSPRRPVSSHGDSHHNDHLDDKEPGSSRRRARSHETDRRRPHGESEDPYYYDNHHQQQLPRRHTRRRSDSPSPRPRPAAPPRDSRGRRDRHRRDASLSTDDDARPLSPRSQRRPSDRRASHRPVDAPHSPRRPGLRPYAPDSHRFEDDRRRFSYDARLERPLAGSHKSSSPVGSPAGRRFSTATPPRPSTHAHHEPLRGRQRSRSRDGARRRRSDEAAASASHPVEQPAHKPKPKPRPRPLSEAGTKPSANESSSAGAGAGLLDQLPKTLATFGGLKILTDHADSAKEWADWLNDLHGAPEEMQALSAKATTAKDTIAQIQRSLAARPDLVEGDSGQVLKAQIEDAIKSASKALADMTELLEDLGSDGGDDGVVVKGLKDFYNSYRYKNEWEGKIKEADASLQKELVTLSTLMVNIYSRALMKPAPPGSTATVSLPVPIDIAAPPKARSASQGEPPKRSKSLHATPAVVKDIASTSVPPAPKPEPAAELPVELDPTPRPSAEKRASRPPSPSVLAYEESMIGTDLAPVDPPVDPPVSSTAPVDPPVSSTTPEQPAATKPSSSQQPSNSKAQEELKHEEPKLDESKQTKPKQPLTRDDCEQALLEAAWTGDIDAARESLTRVSAMTRDLQGLTPLHLTVQKDHLALAMLLLDHKVDCNARDKKGETPLHLAARFASAATVEFLLEKGRCNPNARRDDGRTPLHYAAGAAVDGDEEARDVIRVLRHWGADPTVQDDKGRTPRDVAQNRDHWDASATLRRAERQWEEDHHQNWFQRHVFKK
ncbi:hypothetical protein EDB81DRAFT_942380 [Dactylonectria macrodidyma]|uniref:Uncharacterized protein n=1 Tax=Dactylonectria macrodidyma TaxID=307937 RepID=A0A9P9FLQ5_9HYPO|nr:hypothetical protein EDB81DRAFT_942380 [Dactylonectria macrodidyma]